MLNRVVLMGRLTAEPELKTTNSGIALTNFNIAVERNYCKQGEARETDFISIVAWRQTAEFVCKYFAKGQLIALEGSLQTRTYQDKSGNNRTATEVLADNVFFTGDSREKTSNGSYGNYSVPTPQKPTMQNSTANTYTSSMPENFEELPDNDLPF